MKIDAIFDFPVDVNANGIETGPTEMTHYDFIIRKDQKFLFQKEELEQSKNLQTLSGYYQAFLKFVKAYTLLENTINEDDRFFKIINAELRDFCENYFVDCSDFVTCLRKLIVLRHKKTIKDFNKKLRIQ